MEESCFATFGNMSRVGNRLINIPDGVSLENKDNQLMVKGPNGNLIVGICDEVSVNIEDKSIITVDSVKWRFIKLVEQLEISKWA